MALSFEPADSQYVAYIDEAGDPGLNKVRPIDPDGSSEWLVLGAIVVRRKHEPTLVRIVQNIRDAIKSHQGPALHYRSLPQSRKLIACSAISVLPLRCFVFLSNKKNMRRYSNRRVEEARGASTQEWFYNYCIRVLLERVTEFVQHRSLIEFGRHTHLEIVLSKRGGHRYSQTTAYVDLIRQQARAGTTILNKRVIIWEVLHPALVTSVPHTSSAGAQLADAIASSFFQAVNTSGNGLWDPEPAKALRQRMWRKDGIIRDNGVTIWPPSLHQANLDERQKEIARFYGYAL